MSEEINSINEVLSVIINAHFSVDGVEDNTPIGNMECLWKTIDEKYCFIEEKGLDWNGVLPIYQEKVEALKREQLQEKENADEEHQKKDYQRELFKLMAQMLDTLQDGHVNLYTSMDMARNWSWHEDFPTNCSSI